MKNFFLKAIMLTAFAAIITGASAQEKKAAPIRLSGLFMNEVQGNFSNGEWNNTDWLSISAETDLWKGAKAKGGLYGFYNVRIDQDKSWSVANDRLYFSNLPWYENKLMLSHLGIEQWLANDKVMLWLGVRKAGMDYMFTPYSLFFLNTAIITNPAVGNLWGVPTYGVSSLCFHAQWEFLPGLTLKNSLYNGVYSTHCDQMFRFRPHRDGINNVTEISYKGNGNNPYIGEYHVGLVAGKSLYTGANNDGQKHGGTAWFTNIDQPLITGRYPVGLMLQGGVTRKVVSNCYGYYSVGLQVANLLTEKTRLGVASSRAYFADGIHETDIEVTCSYPVYKNVELQPGLHMIRTSGETNTCGLLRASIFF